MWRKLNIIYAWIFWLTIGLGIWWWLGSGWAVVVAWLWLWCGGGSKFFHYMWARLKVGS